MLFLSVSNLSFREEEVEEEDMDEEVEEKVEGQRRGEESDY